MLFILTGDIQTGKTRWLRDTIDEIDARGVLVEGVLAPGVWRRRTEGELCALASGGLAGDQAKKGVGGSSSYEKLAIENRLMPDGPTIEFGRRRDLLESQGAAEGSQSGKARLGWAIFDEAIDRVNGHFDQLRARRDEPVAAGEMHRAPLDDAGPAHPHSSGGAFLIVDELGILEITRGMGLVSALDLLGCGPSARYPHGLVVVRSALADEARALLSPAWGHVAQVGPDQAGRAAIFEALGL